MKQVITLCCNEKYFNKAYNTIKHIRCNGKYFGDIVFFYDEEFKNKELLNKLSDEFIVILKEFPKIDTSIVSTILNRATLLDYPAKTRLFQFHKFYNFHTYFKQWDKLLYIDCGVHIYNNIDRLLNLDCDNKILAHSNPYPTYIGIWKLSHEFELRNEVEIVNNLLNTYILDHEDFFQSTIMLFDTKIIEENTFTNLITLMNKYPISKANDQGILNLYFIVIKNIWTALPIKDEKGFLYDFWERDNHKCNEYVALKYPQTDSNKFCEFIYS